MTGFKRWRLGLGVGALTLTLGLIAVLQLAFPVAAAPPAQGALPTPTPDPIENLEYELSVVGGLDETLTFDHGEVDGFVIGESTVRSTYPRGMVFTLSPQSPNGAIQDVWLVIRFHHNSGTRVLAEWDDELEAFVAHPWDTGEGQPAWTQFDFHWRVRDVTGVLVETEPIATEYWDPNREWFRLETPVYLVYWWGLSQDDPDRAANYWAQAIMGTEPRRVAGFGEPIAYKPVATVYGNRQAWDETYGSGISNPFAGGLTSHDLGMSVQYIPGRATDVDIAWIGTVITHELTHMYQFQTNIGGPLWWTEGQAEWFALNPGDYDARMMNLATLQDIPSLTSTIGSGTVQADGRRALAYDVGPSFINWLVANYGGIDTMRQIVELQGSTTPVIEAIEEVTGVSFFDLENGWRTYVGFEPLSLADVDPASALEPYDDPMFAVGDVVTLPALPALSPVYEKPGPRVKAIGQCFANMQVTILTIGALEGVPYYEIDCMGQIGWMGREQLVGPE